jgi:hypothetical protein
MPYDHETTALMDQAGRIVEECRHHDRQSVERQKVIAKHFPDVVYKDHHNPPLVQQPQQWMTPEAQEPWNNWVRSEINKALPEQPFTQQQVEVLQFAFADERKDTMADVQAARDEISALRTKIAELEKELGAQRVSAEAAQEFRRLQWLRGTIKKRDDDADA